MGSTSVASPPGLHSSDSAPSASPPRLSLTHFFVTAIPWSRCQEIPEDITTVDGGIMLNSTTYGTCIFGLLHLWSITVAARSIDFQ